MVVEISILILFCMVSLLIGFQIGFHQILHVNIYDYLNDRWPDKWRLVHYEEHGISRMSGEMEIGEALQRLMMGDAQYICQVNAKLSRSHIAKMEMIVDIKPELTRRLKIK